MERKIKTAKLLARLLDNQFDIAGIKFGIDPIVNLIPWLGDILGALFGLFILRTAWQVGVSKSDLLKMVGNIIVDFVIGIIPLVGVIFDVIWKANLRNVAILEKYSHGKFVEGEIVK